MTVRIINADVMAGLSQLADESVNCVVTSPPYWGLRDYGTARWQGGADGCDHLAPAAHGYRPHETSTLGPKRDGIHASNSAHNDAVKRQQFRGVCGKCGAVRTDDQIGLEATPGEFVSRLVGVFREVRRVLRPDGTCWVNLGDSYNAAGRVGHGTRVGFKQASNRASSAGMDDVRPSDPSLKPKDLIGVPWRFALAMQDDGWWLRQDIIWAKPNPMPESVTDRCTKSHEYVFLLTKSERYWYDADAIKERATYPNGANSPQSISSPYGQGFTRNAPKVDEERKALRSDIESRHRASIPGGQSMQAEPDGRRNKRSVWTISTTPFSEAHFATFPPELPELCIKAGCPPTGTVLDPFSGAGTTALVADRLQRNAIGIELNPEYAAMSERRINGDRGALLDLMEV